MIYLSQCIEQLTRNQEPPADYDQ